MVPHSLPAASLSVLLENEARVSITIQALSQPEAASQATHCVVVLVVVLAQLLESGTSGYVSGSANSTSSVALTTVEARVLHHHHIQN